MQGHSLGCLVPLVRRVVLGLATTLAVCAAGPAPSAQADRRQSRIDDALKREAEALVRAADAAEEGRPTRSDFFITWRNDFFKAQPGTFVPFTISFDRSALPSRQALMYVRVVRAVSPNSRRRSRVPYAYETIFPVRMDPNEGPAVRVRRGFAVAPGRYRVVVVLRELAEETSGHHGDRKGAAMVQDLDVPDFWTGELTTSTVILAERLDQLAEPIPTGELDEHPYVVGSTRIQPSPGSLFNRNEELIVVFLVYNPSVGADKHFDLQVDYHLYRKDQAATDSRPDRGDHPAPRAGERYVTRTSPQRFNPALMGPRFDPSGGSPILAGQGILLSNFEPGEYRLSITVADLLSRKTISRDVTFTVIGS